MSKTPQDHKFSINTRVVSEFLSKYRNTFVAFCELVNNSIQAGSKNIWIEVDEVSPEELAAQRFTRIAIRDDGEGVSQSSFNTKILEVGTKDKAQGKGIGRFAALQIGRSIAITTVGINQITKKKTKSAISFDLNRWEGLEQLNSIFLDVAHNEVTNEDTFYEVVISGIHDDGTLKKKDNHKKIHRSLSTEELPKALFAAYPDLTFNSRVRFFVNNNSVTPSDFIIKGPESIKTDFIAGDGALYQFSYSFYLVTSSGSDHKVFLRTHNGDVSTIAHTLDYRAEVPENNAWFIYIDSPYFDEHSDVFRNLDFREMDAEANRVFRAINSDIDEFFRSEYKTYVEFVSRLELDSFYPYRISPATSQAKQSLFNQMAFYVEAEYQVLSKGSKIRELLYPLIDRALESGHLEEVVACVTSLDEATVKRFKSLLEAVDMKEVIGFSQSTADKLQYLDFISGIVYGKPAKHLKERSQLHKIVERHLWIFGERYSNTPTLFSDKNLYNNLMELRTKFLDYKPSQKDDNLAALSDKKLRDITDLFFFNERITDNGDREVMVVELKAPSVKLNAKEINQIERYAYQIEESGVFPDNIQYRLILIGSEVSSFAKSKWGQVDPKEPYVLYRSQRKNISTALIEWSHLIEANRRKLSFLGDLLKVKDVSVKEVWERDYADIDQKKLKSILK